MTKPTMEKASPKMSREQAKIFWKSLTPQQKIDFNNMMIKLQAEELQLENVLVDDNEQIQHIVLKDKPKSIPVEPYAKYFDKENWEERN